MEFKENQKDEIKKLIKNLVNKKDSFYAKKFKGINLKKLDENFEEIFRKLPFTDKDDLRKTYPLGICPVKTDEIVRIHSSSGTTGKPIIIPYTKKDVEDWAIMFKRCYELAGITKKDIIQITPGYGLWTAGIGFQLGAELLGAMSVPTGPGNINKQIEMMEDLKSTVLTSTSSFALLLSEEINKRKIKNKIKLKKGLIGSERWGDKMRNRISKELGVELFDIYGLTEIYGPGIAINCEKNMGMHYFDDYLYFEIINPKTLQVLPKGELGELVITAFRKEGAPLIRYRTHDLTRIVKSKCSCGCSYPMIDRILGRTDDMVKVKGVNVYPGQIEDLLKEIKEVSSEYQVMIDHLEGRDIITLFFEVENNVYKSGVEVIVKELFKERIGLTINPKALSIGELPRSEKKTNRIFDNRY